LAASLVSINELPAMSAFGPELTVFRTVALTSSDLISADAEKLTEKAHDIMLRSFSGVMQARDVAPEPPELDKIGLYDDPSVN
jgi:hypothetical protein